MIYFEYGSTQTSLSNDDLRRGLTKALDRLGERHKVLAVPPDYTRLPSKAGELTRFSWEYYGERLTDILPALGTHTPMTDRQITHMFGDIPRSLFRDHDWRNDVMTLGEVPSEYVKWISEGRADFSWPAQVNKLIIEGGFWSKKGATRKDGCTYKNTSKT
jgi:hypothetical protein